MRHSSCCQIFDRHPPWPGGKIPSVGCTDAPAKSSWCGTPTRCRRPRLFKIQAVPEQFGARLNGQLEILTATTEAFSKTIDTPRLGRTSGIEIGLAVPEFTVDPAVRTNRPSKRDYPRAAHEQNQQVTDARLVGLGRFNLNPNLTEVSEIVESTFGFLDSSLVKGVRDASPIHVGSPCHVSPHCREC